MANIIRIKDNIFKLRKECKTKLKKGHSKSQAQMHQHESLASSAEVDISGDL